MKTQIRNYVFMAFVCLCLCGIIAVSGTVVAGENEYKVTDNEELFVTWINMDYTGGWPPQMIIFKPGEFDCYSSVNDEKPMWTAEYHISQKWTDAVGNIWYKHRYKAGAMGSGFELCKISDSGKTLEFIFSQWGYPDKLDMKDENYRKFTRK